VGRLILTFDSDLDSCIWRWPPHGIFGQGPMVQLVRDYCLTYHDGREWREITAVVDNHQWRREHAFPPVETNALRVEVQATHGWPSAHIFEVRAYDQ
jgi:hypothetical protein